MYGLSFTDEFFYGNGETEFPEVSERPTSVLQAIVSLDDETKRDIAKNVLHAEEDCVAFYIESESFPYDVLSKVKETDLCDDLSSPVTVYIDPEQFYELTIYEEGGPESPYFVSTD